MTQQSAINSGKIQMRICQDFMLIKVWFCNNNNNNDCVLVALIAVSGLNWKDAALQGWAESM